jgi:hemerythrin-like domain-containing protein
MANRFEIKDFHHRKEDGRYDPDYELDKQNIASEPVAEHMHHDNRREGGFAMNSIEILKEDHQKALNLLSELETAVNEPETEPSDTENFNRLNEAIKLHSQIEEELFYPVMKDIKETRIIVERFYNQHKKIDKLLAHLSTIALNQEEFQEPLAELRRVLEIHIEEEEEELFPIAEEKLEQSRLNDIGRQILEMRDNSQTAAASMKRR